MSLRRPSSSDLVRLLKEKRKLCSPSTTQAYRYCNWLVVLIVRCVHQPRGQAKMEAALCRDWGPARGSNLATSTQAGLQGCIDCHLRTPSAHGKKLKMYVNHHFTRSYALRLALLFPSAESVGIRHRRLFRALAPHQPQSLHPQRHGQGQTLFQHQRSTACCSAPCPGCNLLFQLPRLPHDAARQELEGGGSSPP